jgi:MinD superfamily P-loop ATPase
MVVEIRRYLGNAFSAHVHDADRETPNCRLGQISTEHRRWYDSLEEARSDLPYEDCSWCMGSSNSRRSVGVATSAEPA